MTAAATTERLAKATTGDPRWQSILNRGWAADEQFYYSVKTTGVYCRPSCAARLPRPENVQRMPRKRVSGHANAENRTGLLSQN